VTHNADSRRGPSRPTPSVLDAHEHARCAVLRWTMPLVNRRSVGTFCARWPSISAHQLGTGRVDLRHEVSTGLAVTPKPDCASASENHLRFLLLIP
jgi:hypothetical protein